jgi:hypothetical protein
MKLIRPHPVPFINIAGTEAYKAPMWLIYALVPVWNEELGSLEETNSVRS